MPRWALVTGASRGIGKSTAIAFAKSGFNVIVASRTVHPGARFNIGLSNEVILKGSLAETAKIIRDMGSQAVILKLDLADELACLAGVQKVLNQIEHLDVFVNNAVYKGPGDLKRFLDLDMIQYREMVQCNILTPVAIFQVVVRHMEENGSGCILNMNSSSVYMTPSRSVDKGGWDFGYTSTKAAMAQLVSVLNTEVSIRCFNLEPGLVVTEIMQAKGLDEIYSKKFGSISPEVAATVAVYLATAPDAMVQKFEGKSVYAPKLYSELESRL